MPVAIVRDNIINRTVDAVVNAANSKLRAGSGVCGAIFEAAGYHELTVACMHIGFCQAGNAVITPGFNLKANYIIHAVGPVWRGGDNDEEERLVKTYRSALELADENGCESIAFPLISSGIYGMPYAIALACARQAFREFPNERDMRIELVLLDKAPIEEDLPQLDDIRASLEGHPIQIEPAACDNADDTDDSADVPEAANATPSASESIDATERMSDDAAGEAAAKRTGLKHVFSKLFKPKPKEETTEQAVFNTESATFVQTLAHLIGERGLTDEQVCHRANLSHAKLDSIRGNEEYAPGKRTAIQLAIALGLDRQQADFLLGKAGAAFEPASKEDRIVCRFIDESDYDILRINEALLYFDQPLLYD